MGIYLFYTGSRNREGITIINMIINQFIGILSKLYTPEKNSSAYSVFVLLIFVSFSAVDFNLFCYIGNNH
jgi:hypothetical protein